MIGMSIARARAAIRGEKTDRIPLFEMPAHREFLKKLIGRDPSGDTEGVIVEAIKKLDIDMIAFGIPQNHVIEGDDPNLFGLDTTNWRNSDSALVDIWDYNPQTSERVPRPRGHMKSAKNPGSG